MRPWHMSLLTALGALACGQEPAVSLEGTEDLPVHVPPVRAVEVVGDANFLVAPPDPPAPEILRTFVFDERGPVLKRWQLDKPKKRSSPKTLFDTTPNGHADTPGLRLGPEDADYLAPCAAVYTRLPVPSGARFQVTVRVRTHQLAGEKLSAGAGLEVLALSGDKSDPKVESRHLTTTRLRGTTDGWETLSLSVNAERNTKALELRLLRCTGQGFGTATFDDLQIARVSQQTAALEAPDVSRAHRAEPHPLVRRLNPDDDHRPGLLTLAPSTWALRVDRSEAAMLQVGLGVDPRTHPESRVCFNIFDETDLLVRRCVGPDHDETHKDGEGWVDTTVPLPPREGASTLVFSAETVGGPEDAAAIGFWGNPRIVPVKRTADSARKPDVVLFLFDTLRRDRLGFSGHTDRDSSPALDAFVSTGWDFTQATAPTGWTLPSGSTVISGRYPANHGGGWRVRREVQQLKVADVQKKHARTLDFTALADDVPTIAERFRADGYRTVMVASNHFLSPDFGFGRGFDRHAQYGGSSVQGGEKAMNVVRELLEREPLGQGEPLFLLVHFIDPHIPYRHRDPGRAKWAPPDDIPLDQESYRGRTTKKVAKLTDTLRERPDSLLNLYDADIAHADGVFGHILEMVDRPTTGIAVTADHGEEFDDHGHFEHGHQMFQELVHVPLVVRPPGEVSPDKVHAAASIADVYPTLLSWAAIDAGEVDGRVLDPVAAESWGDRRVWLEHAYVGPDRTGYRQGDLKVLFTHPIGWLDSRPNKHRLPLTNAVDTQARTSSKEVAYPIQAGGRAWDLSKDPGEHSPRLLPSDDPLLVPIAQRIRAVMPGLHVQCVRGEEPTRLAFNVDAALVRIAPLALGEDDAIHIPGDRRSVSITLAVHSETGPLGTLPWLVIEGADGAEVTHQGNLPESCTTWNVSARGAFVDLDEESVGLLEALGYMGH